MGKPDFGTTPLCKRKENEPTLNSARSVTSHYTQDVQKATSLQNTAVNNARLDVSSS